MKAKHQRLILALVALCGVAGAGVLAASALRDEAAYFRTPVEIEGGKAAVDEPMRLGGMVAARAASSGRPTASRSASLRPTARRRCRVEYKGIVPDLFGEESGMVADGRMRADGTFVADRILAKHDERYMPPQMGDMPKNMKAPATT